MLTITGDDFGNYNHAPATAQGVVVKVLGQIGDTIPGGVTLFVGDVQKCRALFTYIPGENRLLFSITYGSADENDIKMMVGETLQRLELRGEYE